MTDKEIIIDGVDVSGCSYYKESLNLEYMRIDSCKGYGFCIHNLPSREFVTSPRYDIPRCYGQKFCYYKQLARKTAECEKYENALDSIVTTINDLENEDIVTFPDFSLKENCKIIMGQCNKGYVDILDIISKAKDGNE